MKDNSNTPGKTVAVILAASAVVGVITYLSLPEAPVVQKQVLLEWDHPTPEQFIFEIVSKISLTGSWTVKTQVVGTNAVMFPHSGQQEYFTISRVIDRENTNNFIKHEDF